MKHRLVAMYSTCVMAAVLLVLVAGAGTVPVGAQDTMTPGISASDSISIEFVKGFATPDDALDVWVENGVAYVAAGAGGLQIVDVSNPRNASQIATHPGYFSDLHLVEQRLYAAHNDVEIIDVSTPAAPTSLGNIVTSSTSPFEIYATESLAYVGSYGSLEINGVDKPGEDNHKDFVFGLAVSDIDVDVSSQTAYITTGTSQNTLQILDVSDPTNAQERGSYAFSTVPRGIHVVRGLAYVVLGDAGLQILDVSDPDNPRLRGSVDLTGKAVDVQVNGTFAYIADEENGVKMLDVSDPDNPREVASADTPGKAERLQVVGNYIYVADGSGGLRILRVKIDIDIGFRPDKDGYSFSNYNVEFSDDFPRAGLGFLDYNPYDMVAMFGAENVFVASVPLGNNDLSFLKPTASIWMLEQNRRLLFGHCLGISATSLRFFAGLDNPAADFGHSTTYDIPRSASGINNHPALNNYIARYHVVQFLDPAKSARNQRLRTMGPTDVLRAISSAMADGNYPVLAIANVENIDETGPVPNIDLKDEHAIVPYAIEETDNVGVYSVMVYDSNFEPGRGRTLVIDTVNRTWNYVGDGIEYSGDENSHTLSYLTLDELNIEPDAHSCPAWCDNPVVAGEVPRSEIWSYGQGRLLITDADGRRLGYMGDQFVNEIPDAEIISTLGGLGNADATYVVPLNGEYTITASGTMLAQEEPAGITQFGPGFAVRVDNIAAQDEITIAPDGTEVSYQAGSGNEPSLIIARDEPTESYLFEIRDADVSSGQTIHAQVDTNQGQLVFSNDQGSSGDYDLAFSRISADGEQAFVHRGISMAAGDTHYADYGVWDGSGDMRLEIDEGSDGSIDQTLLLQNQANQVYLPLIASGQLAVVDNPAPGPDQTPTSTPTDTPVPPTSTPTDTPVPPTNTPIPGNPPAAPGNPTTFVISPSELQISWDDNSDNEDHFVIRKGIATVATLDANTYFHVISGLIPGNQYCFSVLATNDYGDSAEVDAPCITMPAPPDAPSNFSLLPLNSNEFYLSWQDESDNETGFVISDGVNTVANLTTDSSFHIVGGHDPETYGCFRVKAVNSYGDSAWSDWACGWTLIAPADTRTAAPLLNDFPFDSYHEDVTAATTSVDDPTNPCTGSQHYQTVWYKVEPFTSGQMTLDTHGSNYDTVLGVWKASGPTALQQVACSDDADGQTTSKITALDLEGGATYYIEIAAYFDTDDPKLLDFYADFTTP